MLRPLLFGLAMLASGAVLAADLEEADKAQIAARVAFLDAAIAGSDFSALTEVIPPRILDHIAGRFGATVEELKAAMVEQMAAAMETASIEESTMDLAQSLYLETADGTPYALIPTRTVVAVKDQGKFEALSQTLAIQDDGAWYLVRVDEASQINILREVYPSFAGTEFPASSVREME